MKDFSRYRHTFLVRLLQIANAGSVGVAVLAGVTCSRSPLLSESDGTGGQGGAGGVPNNASGGGGGGGGAASSTGAFNPVTSSVASSSSGNPNVYAATCCLPQDDAGPCLEASEAWSTVDASLYSCAQLPDCGYLEAIVNGPVLNEMSCCYDVEVVPFPCYVGRTFFLDEGIVKADVRPGGGWLHGGAPSVEGLSEATRRALADAWARDGLFEHASVASFSRFAVQLLAVGAPASLVRDTHAAAIDEVRHAELSLALASGYRGEPIEPGPLPMPGPLVIDPDLPAIAAESAMEGCIGETVATLQALEALARTTDPAVREVLAVTIEDEARHAELAWRFLAWAIDNGGEATRAAIIRSFASFCPPPPSPEVLDGVDLDAFAAHGRLRAAEARAIADRALREVVGPCVCALLARPAREPDSRPRAGGAAVAAVGLELSGA